MDTRISHAQILVAHAFARALRHRWAYHVDPDRVGVTTPAEIRDLVAAADDPDHPCFPPGIVCPALDDGDIVHTSASGTVAWRVPWVGLATLAVRPWTGSIFAAEAIARLLVAVSGLARRGVLVDVVIDPPPARPAGDVAAEPSGLVETVQRRTRVS